jgi:hypothetical protein
MIAVSSHRPKASCSPEIWRNQLAAHESWLAAFDKVVYFGTHDDELSLGNSKFFYSEDFPTIFKMAHLCSLLPGWSCIVNADIVLLPETFRAVELELGRKQAASAMSLRFDYDPRDPNRKIRNYDQGIDIFCARQSVWKSAASKIPDSYRIGHPTWDNWMMGFFNIEGKPCYEFTGSRCVLHPKHGDRRAPHPIDATKDVYPGACTCPKRKISVQAVVDIRKAKDNR